MERTDESCTGSEVDQENKRSLSFVSSLGLDESSSDLSVSLAENSNLQVLKAPLIGQNKSLNNISINLQ